MLLNIRVRDNLSSVQRVAEDVDPSKRSPFHLAKPKFTESKPKRMEPPVFLFWVWQKA